MLNYEKKNFWNVVTSKKVLKKFFTEFYMHFYDFDVLFNAEHEYNVTITP